MNLSQGLGVLHEGRAVRSADLDVWGGRKRERLSLKVTGSPSTQRIR